MIGQNYKADSLNLKIQKFIGKGKSGHSYLAVDESGKKYVVKKIHHEPCPSYQFDDKFEAEIRAYNRLKELIKIPEMFFYSREDEVIVKEYIEGVVLSELIALDGINQNHINLVTDMTKSLYPEKINIDFFPSNFVVSGDEMYYIDYELNGYMDEWNFENWGIYFLANPKGMKKFLETGAVDEMLITAESGKPIKDGFEERVKSWLENR